MVDSETQGVYDEGTPSIAVSVQALRGVHDGQRSFTVVDSDALPIGSVEAFLRHLTALGYSPNTVRAYAHDLADLSPGCVSPGVTGAG